MLQNESSVHVTQSNPKAYENDKSEIELADNEKTNGFQNTHNPVKRTEELIDLNWF